MMHQIYNKSLASQHTSGQTNFCADDEVEIPDSPCEGDGIFSRMALQCVRNAEFISGYSVQTNI